MSPAAAQLVGLGITAAVELIKAYRAPQDDPTGAALREQLTVIHGAIAAEPLDKPAVFWREK